MRVRTLSEPSAACRRPWNDCGSLGPACSRPARRRFSSVPPLRPLPERFANLFMICLTGCSHIEHAEDDAWQRRFALGFVGANVRSNWASQSHFPALLASPDVDMTAVCTTKPESAEEARKAFGAQLAFHDFRAMVASPEIDAVAVVVRVPSHYEPTRAAI